MPKITLKHPAFSSAAAPVVTPPQPPLSPRPAMSAELTALPSRKRSSDSSTPLERPRPPALRPSAQGAAARVPVVSQMDEESRNCAVPVTEQSAIGYPAGRRRRLATKTSPGPMTGVDPAGKAQAIDPLAPPSLPPRSLANHVFSRAPFRDKDHPELIEKRYAVLNEDGSFDQTKCDERWECRNVTFDGEFEGMMKNLKGEGGHEESLSRLKEQGRLEIDEMIHNREPPSLKQYQSTELKRSHCQSTEQWKQLKKEGMARGVTLIDYKKQEPWTLGPVCARIAVPPGGEQAYKDKLGQTAFDNFAIEMKIRRSMVKGSLTKAGTWHAALYGCGIAQLFNGAKPGEEFHFVYANAVVEMSHPERGTHLEPMPLCVQIKKVPRGKQPLAWYGDGWFESRPQFQQVSQGGQIDDGGQQQFWDERLSKLPHPENRTVLAKMKRALYGTSVRRTDWRQDPELPEARAHAGAALDFVEQLRQPLTDWLREHDSVTGAPEERVQNLAYAAAEMIVPLSSVDAESASRPDPSRLKPLMQQLLDFPVQMDGRKPLGSGALRLKFDSIGHLDNRLDLIQLNAAAEAQLSRIRTNPSEFRKRLGVMQQSIINPANRLLDWFGPRSAREWAVQHAPLPESGATETEVSMLLTQLTQEGWPKVGQNLVRPLLRQMLDLPVMYVKTKSLLGEYLDELKSPEFDDAAKKRWHARIGGINDLPDDEVRAAIMYLWNDSIPKIEQKRNWSKSVKNKKVSAAGYPLNQMVRLCAHWNKPEALQQWLDATDPGPNATVVLEDRWLKVLDGLKKKFPLESHPNLVRTKLLFTQLLEHRDGVRAASSR